MIYFKVSTMFWSRFLIVSGLKSSTRFKRRSLRINFFAYSQKSLIFRPSSNTFSLTSWLSLKRKMSDYTTFAAGRGGLGKLLNWLISSLVTLAIASSAALSIGSTLLSSFYTSSLFYCVFPL